MTEKERELLWPEIRFPARTGTDLLFHLFQINFAEYHTLLKEVSWDRCPEREGDRSYINLVPKLQVLVALFPYAP
jgi:hypothetical protein